MVSLRLLLLPLLHTSCSGIGNALLPCALAIYHPLCADTNQPVPRSISRFGRPRFPVPVKCFRIANRSAIASSTASARSLCFAAATSIDAKADWTRSAVRRIHRQHLGSQDLQEEPRSRSRCSPSLPRPLGPCYPTRLEPLVQQILLLLLTNRLVDGCRGFLRGGVRTSTRARGRSSLHVWVFLRGLGGLLPTINEKLLAPIPGLTRLGVVHENQDWTKKKKKLQGQSVGALLRTAVNEQRASSNNPTPRHKHRSAAGTICYRNSHPTSVWRTCQTVPPAFQASAERLSFLSGELLGKEVRLTCSSKYDVRSCTTEPNTRK